MTEEEPLEHFDQADEGGLALWALVLGVTPQAVLSAVTAVGTSARQVQVEIENSPSTYHPRRAQASSPV
ncbi:DUF3606 domain-containing protein [Luteibacter sp.]|uniref:DUF3606 domain-containing protein n=1 Tax=Luteibacter sp. TaxID=1886636 RepID=UPI003F7F1414